MNEDRAARYHRLKRRAAALSTLWGATLLLVLASPGGGAVALRDAVTRAVGALGVPPPDRPAWAVVGYVLLFVGLHELIALPLAFYRGFTLDRRFGLSTQSVRGWLRMAPR